MDKYQLIAEQDKQRSVRNFISLAAGVFGVDQTYASEDNGAVGAPAVYQAIGVNGAYGVQGQPISNLQTGAVVLSPGFLMLAALAAVAVMAVKK